MLGASWWGRMRRRLRGIDPGLSVVWTMPNSTAERGNATLRPCSKFLLLVPTGCVLNVPIRNNATEHSFCCAVRMVWNGV
jgi:hypothetical protein